jgi:hypothetical protein
MTKEQCTAIIQTIAASAKYFASVKVQFDNKPFPDDALSTLNDSFDGEIEDIIADIPDDSSNADDNGGGGGGGES